MIARMPIDFQYEIMTYSWLDAMLSTDVVSLVYFILAIVISVLGSFIFFKGFDNTATSIYMN